MALLIIIYIGFISLGVPDSLIGSAWAAIYPELGVSSEMISYVTMIISGCTVLSSFISGKLLNRFGTAKVTVVSTAMTAVAMLGFSFASNLWIMCICAVPLGLGAGAIDAGLNDYITTHYEAKHVNLLHCFYGVGVTCSPVLMSLALSNNNQWRIGYRYAFILQASITALLILSLPLWKKQQTKEMQHEELTETKVMAFKEMLKTSEIRIMWAVIFLINALECICGTWGATFIAQGKNVSADEAAKLIAFFYIGLTIGRFSSGIISNKISTWNRIYIGIGSILVALVLLCLPSGSIVAAIGFCLIGFGIGPIYPNLLFLVPYSFGKDVSGSIMGTLIGFAYSSYIVMPIIFGWVQKLLGISSYPFFLVCLFILFIIFLYLEIIVLKRKSRYDDTV